MPTRSRGHVGGLLVPEGSRNSSSSLWAGMGPPRALRRITGSLLLRPGPRQGEAFLRTQAPGDDVIHTKRVHNKHNKTVALGATWCWHPARGSTQQHRAEVLVVMDDEEAAVPQWSREIPAQICSTPGGVWSTGADLGAVTTTSRCHRPAGLHPHILCGWPTTETEGGGDRQLTGTVFWFHGREPHLAG